MNAFIQALPIAPWILFTVFAAAMQSIRTAGQKSLSQSITPMSATLVRYVFGLPIALLYLYSLTGSHFVPSVAKALAMPEFLQPAVLAGIFQIVATALLIRVFRYRNFMVGTSFAKTESIQTAMLGMIFFSTSLTLWGWVAVVLGVVAVWFMAMPSRKEPWDIEAIGIGLASGASFALTSLWIRQASLTLPFDTMTSAGITLVLVVSFQSVLCVIYTAVRTPADFLNIAQRWPLAVFVGVTSALGSIGWFTAMSWQNPALVKSLGQVEMLFTAALTLRYFREQVRWVEWLGVVLLMISVTILITG